MEHEIENRVPNISSPGGDSSARLHKDSSQKDDESSPASRQSKSASVKKIQKMFKNAVEGNIRSFGVYITELKELVAKLHYQKQLLVCQARFDRISIYYIMVLPCLFSSS
jgi:centromeric protein E